MIGVKNALKKNLPHNTNNGDRGKKRKLNYRINNTNI